MLRSQNARIEKMTHVLLRILKRDTTPAPHIFSSEMELKMIPIEDLPSDAVALGMGTHKVDEYVIGPTKEVERYVHSLELLKKRQL
jgi:hypothetical protein